MQFKENNQPRFKHREERRSDERSPRFSDKGKMREMKVKVTDRISYILSVTRLIHALSRFIQQKAKKPVVKVVCKFG